MACFWASHKIKILGRGLAPTEINSVKGLALWAEGKLRVLFCPLGLGSERFKTAIFGHKTRAARTLMGKWEKRQTAKKFEQELVHIFLWLGLWAGLSIWRNKFVRRIFAHSISERQLMINLASPIWAAIYKATSQTNCACSHMRRMH